MMGRTSISQLLATSVFLFIASTTFHGCITSYYRDWATRLLITGDVREMETQRALSEVKVLLESETLLGKGEIEELTVSDSNGHINASFDRKWGCKQNAMEARRGKKPRVDVTIRLVKKNYIPVELKFKLDEISDLSGDVPINLQTIYLSRESNTTK